MGQKQLFAYLTIGLFVMLLLACGSSVATKTPTVREPTATPVPSTPTAVPAGQCEYARHAEARNAGGTTPALTDPVIKGTINEADQKIYFVPGMRRYLSMGVDEAKGERWFCSRREAESAGWRISAAAVDAPTPRPGG